MDVKNCDLVISYDASTTSCGASFIQLSGRARKPNSRFVIFIQELADELSFDNAVIEASNQSAALSELF